jgi:hypothetical protein
MAIEYGIWYGITDYVYGHGFFVFRDDDPSTYRLL